MKSSVLKIKYPLRNTCCGQKKKKIVLFDTNSLEQFANGAEAAEFT